MKDIHGDLISSLAKVNEKKIVLLVLDGLGDTDNNGKGTALQMAQTPNLDQLSRRSAQGLAYPVAPGITPGSGPGHLGLFGYDPLIYQVGRGVLSALGIGFGLKENDLAARLNFCTLDESGKVKDRRAGRISTEKNQELTEKIRNSLRIDQVEVILQTVSEHRALLVLRGKDLDSQVGDTDPQQTGKEPLDPSREPYGESRTTKIVKEFFAQVSEILQEEPQANMMLSRGFAIKPHWPSFSERYRLNAAAIAGYPMYRGIARLLGMKLLSDPREPQKIMKDTVNALKDHDFVFSHFKDPDKKGEDGNIDDKVRSIEKMDQALPLLLDHEPDVLIITGDHSTPAPLAAHSWHPVPLLMKAPAIRGPFLEHFDEVMALRGELGRIKSMEIMGLAMAHAGKLEKFGA